MLLSAHDRCVWRRALSGTRCPSSRPARLRADRTRPGLGTVPTGRRKNHRMRPLFLDPMVSRTGTVVASQPAATMDARVTTATLLSSAHHCKRPMLLVHGFLATPRVVGRLASGLSRLGYCPHGVDLGGLFGRFNARPVEELAGVVADRVEQLARDHRCERIDLVGYSEGGLIGRYYIQ